MRCVCFLWLKEIVKSSFISQSSFHEKSGCLFIGQFSVLLSNGSHSHSHRLIQAVNQILLTGCLSEHTSDDLGALW